MTSVVAGVCMLNVVSQADEYIAPNLAIVVCIWLEAAYIKHKVQSEHANSNIFKVLVQDAYLYR